MLEKHTKIDKIEIVGEFKTVQVRQATQVIEGDNPIGKPEYHRYVIHAGQDCSGQPREVQSVCAAVHTPEIVAAYQASIAQPETAERT